jgi:hypothetical protein
MRAENDASQAARRLLLHRGPWVVTMEEGSLPRFDLTPLLSLIQIRDPRMTQL